MGTQIKTAKELLAQIERRYFTGARLAKASTLEGDERRAFVLTQVERLLTVKHGLLPMAMWLSDEFWTAAPGRLPMYKSNPLLAPLELQALTDRERSRVALILDIAGLCHDLILHYRFDLKETLGVKDKWWVSNRQLVEWLSTTEYEQTATHVAYILKQHATEVYACSHYQPAQDAMAELYSSEYRELVREPYLTEMPPRAYVKAVVDEFQRVERHRQRGRRLKLPADVVMLHDEIYGFVPRQFSKWVLQAAQALYDYMDQEVYGRMTGDNPSAPEVMKRFAEKVREVRSEYLAKGWVEDNSLEFSYLMAHAQNCGNGFWGEEDDAL